MKTACTGRMVEASSDETLLRLAGDLARAEKQYRECPAPQKAIAWKIMEEAGDRIRNLIDGMVL